MIRNIHDKKIKEKYQKISTPQKGSYGWIILIIVLVLGGIGFLLYNHYKPQKITNEQQFGFKFY